MALGEHESGRRPPVVGDELHPGDFQLRQQGLDEVRLTLKRQVELPALPGPPESGQIRREPTGAL